jgi:hypothetical protein
MDNKEEREEEKIFNLEDHKSQYLFRVRVVDAASTVDHLGCYHNFRVNHGFLSL